MATRRSISTLVKALGSPTAPQREEAIVELAACPAEEIATPVSEHLLLEGNPECQAACLDVLERHGLAIGLSSIRADDWFEQLGSHMPNFDQICDVLGAHFLAYSMILGVQLRSLVVNRLAKSATTVEFCVSGDLRVQSLPLAEFRIRVVHTLLQEARLPYIPSVPITKDDAAALIGGRSLLIAPLFGIKPEHLSIASLDFKSPRYVIGFLSEVGFSFIDLRDFDEMIRAKVRRDLAIVGPAALELDLDAVDSARVAFDRGDFDEVIETLETWPGVLGVIQRTIAAQDLDPAQRTKIAVGLRMLGIAFEQRDREEWSEELYRLGIQYARDSKGAGPLFLSLGLLFVRQKRFSESIAPLRRALRLGENEQEVLPALGRAFLEIKKIIPAMALLERASSLGCRDKKLRRDLKSARRALTNSGVSWNVPKASPERDPARADSTELR